MLKLNLLTGACMLMTVSVCLSAQAAKITRIPADAEASKLAEDMRPYTSITCTCGNVTQSFEISCTYPQSPTCVCSSPGNNPSAECH